MTDRLKGLTVTLEDSINEDSAIRIIEAISMVKGVLVVTPSVDNFGDIMNRSRIKHELRQKLFRALE